MKYVRTSDLYSPRHSSGSFGSDSQLQETAGTAHSARVQYAWGTLTLCVLTTSLTSVLLGYDVGIMSAALPLMEESLSMTSFEVGVIAGSLNFIAGFGAAPFGSLADILGRRPAMLLACVVFAFGTLLMSLSTNFYSLLLARGLMGCGVGATFVIAPVYLSELVPAEFRGALVCVFDIFINVGILVGFVGGYLIDTLLPFGDDLKWRLMIGVGVLPPVCIAFATKFLPESPRWLVSRGRRVEAENSLGKVVLDDHTVKEEVDLMAIAARTSSESTYSEVICPPSKSMQRALHVTLGLSILQQATGSEAAILFTPLILKEAGVLSTKSQLLWALPVGFAKLTGELISVPLLDKVGRRPLLLVGGGLQCLFLVLLTTAYWADWLWQTKIVAISAFMLSFEIAAPIAWLMPSEVYGSRPRGKAQSIAVSVNRMTSGIIVLSFPMLIVHLGPVLIFSVFASLAFFSVIWAYYVVPETAGLTLEEVETLLREESFGHLSASQAHLPIQYKTRKPHGREKGYGTLGWQASRQEKKKHTTARLIDLTSNSDDIPREVTQF